MPPLEAPAPITSPMATPMSTPAKMVPSMGSRVKPSMPGMRANRSRNSG